MFPHSTPALIRTARKNWKPFKVNKLEYDSFLYLEEITEQTAWNFTVQLRGEKLNFNDNCVLRVAKGHPNQFFFKTSYTNSECKCVNVTSSKTRNSFKLFQKVQLKKFILILSPFPKDLQFLINNRILPHCHLSFYNGLKFEQEWFKDSGFSLVIFLTKVCVSMSVW